MANASPKKGESLLDGGIGMALCCSGIYGAYLLYAILQEGIYKKYTSAAGERFTFTFTLLLLQCATNMIGAVVGQLLHGPPPNPGIPPSAFIQPAASYITAMMTSNEALKYVSLPVQVLAKSCKMVPVMAAKVMLYDTKYTWREYLMVVLVTTGIVVYRMKANDESKSSEWYGLGLLAVSLIADGVTGPKQESIRQEHNASAHQIMLYCNVWASLGVVGGMLMTEGTDGLVFIMDNPDLTQKIGLFCAMSAVGQNFIFLTLHKFGALTLATVTTTRKFFTVLASVMYYGHVLETQQWAGIGLVMSGLGLELYGKYTRTKMTGLTQKDA